ncbi:Gfo/Idh/MocA family protein [Occultella gossypii]|uniref:Gfo/Idh/MocA family oxidoreductase n=1 Tax=Occultella gossypii TaxID=2800820 RepID=A0ABS7S3T6_9MICO|nr:Gfo/Idh/MocA family oxidoreductase [Occultella gossypii]MBZ2194962.1 Gfo/Idh/MocA family oxidoreductase [Occultella gossypii]
MHRRTKEIIVLKVGIIGTGFWATETHAPVLGAHPDARLVGIWGRRPQAAERAAVEAGTRAFVDLDEMLGEVDAVVLTVPPTAQVDLAVRCAEAGKHLLLEKPLALDPNDSARIVRAVTDADVAALVFFTSRHRPEQSAWIQAAAQRPWFTAHACWTASLFPPDQIRDPANWRHTHGALWDVGPHALSVALGVLGPATSVTAASGPGDTVHLALQHTTGASSTATLSLTAPERAGQSQFTAYGEAGILTMPIPLSTPQEAAHHAISDLARMARTGEREHGADLRLGARVTATLHAASAALRTGSTVALD